METQSSEVVGVDEGVSSSVPETVAGVIEYPDGTRGLANTQPSAVAGDTVPEEVQGEPQGPPTGYEGVPSELWPDADGKPPQLTEALMRVLRGKYFTVRHTLGECGHKIDSINQPRGNCHACWGVFFGTHPQLCEIAHDLYQNQGRGPMVAMRGEKFTKMFEKYMALLYRAHIERLKQQEKTSGVENLEPGTTDTASSAGPNLAGETASVSEVR